MHIHRGTHRTNILSHTKLKGHLSSSQQNETDISNQWNHSKCEDGLNCCVSIHSQQSVITHFKNSCVIKKHRRTNQLINQQTNNKPVRPFRKWFTMSDWLTDCEYLNFFLYFYFVGLQTSNNQQTCKTSIKKEEVLCKWHDWIPDWVIHFS